MALSDDHPVGREPELERLGRRSTSWSAAGIPASPWKASRGSARRGCCPSCGAGPRSGAISSWRERRRSSSATSRSASGSTRSTRTSPRRNSTRSSRHRRAALDWGGVRRRAASSPSGAASAAGRDRGAQAARAGPRRPALERPGLDRGARRAAAPRYDRAGAAGAGFRSGKAPAKLVAALAGATIIDLGPLSETECARLVGDGPTRSGDLRPERRQPVLHAPAGAGHRLPVAQLDRRSPRA